MARGRMTETRPIDSILAEARHRKDLGDLSDLMASINNVGLLHPIAITTTGRLVAGQRRLEACRQLGWAEVPVTVVTTVESSADLLHAERDENTCRLDMRPSENVALGRVLEELERPRAKQRQARRGQSDRSEKFPERSARGETRDKVGVALGMSGPTYQRAKVVVEKAEAGDPVAKEALAEMDETGKVNPAYRRVIRKTPKHGSTKRPEPYALDTPRKKQLAEKQKRRLVASLSEITGACRGLREMKFGMVAAVCTDEEISDWADKASELARDLKAVKARLMEVSIGG